MMPGFLGSTKQLSTGNKAFFFFNNNKNKAPQFEFPTSAITSCQFYPSYQCTPRVHTLNLKSSLP